METQHMYAGLQRLISTLSFDAEIDSALSRRGWDMHLSDEVHAKRAHLIEFTRNETTNYIWYLSFSGPYNTYRLCHAVRKARSVSVTLGAGRSSEVERSLMVRWVVGSIELFLVPARAP